MPILLSIISADFHSLWQLKTGLVGLVSTTKFLVSRHNYYKEGGKKTARLSPLLFVLRKEEQRWSGLLCEEDLPILPNLWWPAPSAGRRRPAASLSPTPSPSPWDSSRSSTGRELACPYPHSHTAATAQQTQKFQETEAHTAMPSEIFTDKTQQTKLNSTLQTRTHIHTPWRSAWGSDRGWGCWCRRIASAGCLPLWR